MTPKYLIDSILPSEEIHTLAGPSGAGKTTVLLNLINEWQQGKPIFGHKSNPQPYVYVSCDRSRKSVNSTLERLSLTGKIDRILCRSDFSSKLSLNEVLTKSTTKFKDANTFFIEGIALLSRTYNNDYQSIGDWLASVTGLCETNKFTILGVAHSPKLRENAAVIHPREAILGSVAWGAYSDTVIYVDTNENDQSRIIQIMPRNAPPEEHHFMFGEGGSIIWISEDSGSILEMRLLARDPGSKITKDQVINIATSSDISERTAERVLTKLVASGDLIRSGRGLYVRSAKNNVVDVDFKVSSQV